MCLNLKAGELVTVRSKKEILATLDENGCLDALPFMPEMFAYCGRRLRAYKRAHKTCDTINFTGGRRMSNAVHLENVRCDGQAHGGCQAECLIFWKEAWLTRVSPSVTEGTGAPTPTEPSLVTDGEACTERDVWANATTSMEITGDVDPVFICQATRLLEATSPLAWWDLRQYWEDYTSGNVGVKRMIGVFWYSFYNKLRGLPWIGMWFKKFYNRFQTLRGRPRHPRTWGRITPGSPTPTADLNLQPGELVRVKSFDAILDTIDYGYHNRGMKWDAEMVPYCRGTYRVRQRVQQIIDEKTGKMRKLKNPCLILEGVVCQARYSECRLFCPRSIYPYWREIWLERISSASKSSPATVAQALDQTET